MEGISSVQRSTLLCCVKQHTGKEGLFPMIIGKYKQIDPWANWMTNGSFGWALVVLAVQQEPQQHGESKEQGALEEMSNTETMTEQDR